MAFGFGFGMPRSFAVPPFSPLSLFSGGAPGAWYDPSDYTTLFQDSAGTTPVTAVEQPVGLMLDKSQGLVASTKSGEIFGASGAVGNYFSSPDSVAASIAGDIDIRVNAALNDWTPALAKYLVGKWATTGQFSYLVELSTTGVLTLYWSTTGSNIISRSATAPLGLANGANKWIRATLDVDNNAGGHDVRFYTSNDGVDWVQLGSTVTTAGTTSIFDSTAPLNVAGFNNGVANSIEAGRYYRAQILNGINGMIAVDFNPTLYTGGSAFTAATGEVWTLNGLTRIVPNGNHAFQATSASRPVLSARVNKLLATAALATQSVTTRATAHTLRFEGAGSVTLTGTAIGVYTAGTHSITTTAGTLTLTVLGSVTSADLRETNDGVGVPAYQAVVTSTNYNTTGFLPYLNFDGVDDSLSTNSISFTSTDKMSVFAGVRYQSLATTSIVAELSSSISSNNGTFIAYGENSSTTNFSSKGTISSGVLTSSVLSTPITIVQTGLGDISGDRATLRVNGAQVAQSTADQGTGNFGNYPLYIGRRNNASFPFNGQMYSLIIVGKAVTAGELSSTETWVATKTGVTL